ncbi:MAG: hypothetical protein WCA51_07435 [Dehalococcoidia bacterium]
MNKNFWLLFRVVIVLILATVLVVGCGKEGSPQGGVISEVTMAAAVDSNDRPLQPTDVFTVDAEAFYCSFKLSHFPPGTKINADWIFMAGQAAVGLSDNTVLQKSLGTVDGDGYTSIVLKRPDIAGVKWPRGDYKVVLSVGDEEKASASFRVE